MDIDIKIGDIILGGRFKNKRIKVKKFGTDDLGQPTVNSRKLLSYRIEKLLPVSKQSSKTREENMNKEAYDFGFQDEIEKIAELVSELKSIVVDALKLEIGIPEIEPPYSPVSGFHWSTIWLHGDWCRSWC